MRDVMIQVFMRKKVTAAIGCRGRHQEAAREEVLRVLDVQSHLHAGILCDGLHAHGRIRRMLPLECLIHGVPLSHQKHRDQVDHGVDEDGGGVGHDVEDLFVVTVLEAYVVGDVLVDDIDNLVADADQEAEEKAPEASLHVLLDVVGARRSRA